MTIPGPADLAARTERALALVRAAYRHEPLEITAAARRRRQLLDHRRDPERVPDRLLRAGRGRQPAGLPGDQGPGAPGDVRRHLRALPVPLVRDRGRALGARLPIVFQPGEEPAVARPRHRGAGAGRPTRAAGPGARRPHAPRARLHRPLSGALGPARQLHGRPVSPEHRAQPGGPRAARHLDGGGADGRPRADGLLHDRPHRLAAAPEGARRGPCDGGAFHTWSRCPTASAACGSPTTTAPSSRRGSTASSWCPTTAASSRPSAAGPSTTAATAATSWRTTWTRTAWWA